MIVIVNRTGEKFTQKIPTKRCTIDRRGWVYLTFSFSRLIVSGDFREIFHFSACLQAVEDPKPDTRTLKLISKTGCIR